MTKKLDRFGRYLILDHLVDGGMAQIGRARILSEDAVKIVAIKMVRPQFSSDPSFQKMFMDEIKVTFGLSHPNIAQTYDYGMIDDKLFNAIEYVDGKNLKQYSDKLKEMKFIFPLEISLYIISQVCQALSYAHNFSDQLTGKKLNIIHRDISPHNIMITYDGSVKVIDFGIAKANTNTEETKAGTIKGKISYIAPEYLETSSLDHRYDQFAVGITFWELVCGRKLFGGDNELAILKKIQDCKIPLPSSINKKVKPALDEIITKSLARDPNKRFENMEQFNRAIVKYLYENYPDFNQSDLKYFSHQLFKKDIEEDREKMLEFGKMDISPYLQDLKNEVSGGTASTQETNRNGGESLQKEEKRKKEVVLELNSDEKEDQTVSHLRENLQKKLKEAEKLNLEKSKSNSSLSGSNSTGIHSTKSNTTIKEFRPTTKRKNSTPVIIAFIIGILIFYKFPQIKRLVQSFQESEIENIALKEEIDSASNPESINSARSNQEENVTSQKVSVVPTTGKLLLNNYDIFQVIYINNQEVTYNSNGIEFPFGEEFQLRVEQDDKLPFFATITLQEEKEYLSIPELKPSPMGILNSSRDFPDGAKIFINIGDHQIIYSLPIEEKKFPVGEYTGHINIGKNDLLKKVKFSINENTITRITP